MLQSRYKTPFPAALKETPMTTVGILLRRIGTNRVTCLTNVALKRNGHKPMDNTETAKTTKQYKDTVFRTLFGSSKNFLELYNAVTGETHPGDTDVTLFPANSLIAKFNDLAGLIGNQFVAFFEHQSTISKNLPLRLLSYATDALFLNIVDRDKLYGSALVSIPTPRFYVLYNGEQTLQTREMKLSDAFAVKETEPALELTVKVVDINYGSGSPLLDRSISLKGYSFLISEIHRNQRSGMLRDQAIITALDYCIKQDILKDFLTDNYAEVIKMLNYEYDAEAEKRVLLQEGRLEGIQEGMQKGMQKGRLEGRLEGVQEGRLEGQARVLELLKSGYTLNEIEDILRREHEST